MSSSHSKHRSTLGNSAFPLLHMEFNKTPMIKCINQQVLRLFSRKLSALDMPHQENRKVPSIWSYFSRAQRDIRERRADGIPVPDPTQRQSTNLVYSLRNPGSGESKTTELRSGLYTLQTLNLTIALTSVWACAAIFSGQPLPIPWSEECLICDQIGIGLLGAMTSIMYFGSMFVLWRFPIR